MNNVLLRSITGLFFILSIILPLLFSVEVSIGVFSFYAFLGYTEFLNLFDSDEKLSIPKKTFFSLAVVIVGLHIVIVYGFLPPLFYYFILLLLFMVTTFELWRKKKHPLLNLSVSIFGLFYVILPFLLAISITYINTATFPYLLGMFILIWANDTFAYLSGRFFGKHKLFERISPKKTWEGTVGGILFTMLFAIPIVYFTPEKDFLFWILSALIIATTSVFGDLIESMFKREFKVKDTGNILPGHGGILDRFDAALYTIPIFLGWMIFYAFITNL